MPDVELLGHLGQCFGIDDGLPEIGELALVQAVLLAVRQVGHHPPQHRAAKELQPFVEACPATSAHHERWARAWRNRATSLKT